MASLRKSKCEMILSSRTKPSDFLRMFPKSTLFHPKSHCTSTTTRTSSQRHTVILLSDVMDHSALNPYFLLIQLIYKRSRCLLQAISVSTVAMASPIQPTCL